MLEQAEMYEEAGRPDLGADIRRELAGLPEEEAKQHVRKVAEAFLSFGGGTFSANGRRVGKGGPGRQGFIKRAMSAAQILYENRNRIRITHCDYRSVLAELGRAMLPILILVIEGTTWALTTTAPLIMRTWCGRCCVRSFGGC